ncbi:MAG: tetratricopeptide repeat protein [Deltaproteobacteria bacterium]|jgi:tetratricopeptide (TPR) repeat protein|nr:tetratricopeptide repeat protein [Deltaproteobacteria bacterium]
MARSNVSWNLTTATPPLPEDGHGAELASAAKALKDPGGLARALEASVREDGPDHPRSIRLGELMGLSLAARGNNEGARVRLAAALAGNERISGELSPDTLRTAMNMGCAWFADGQYRKALPFFKRASEGMNGTPASGSPEALAVRNNLACAMAAAGDPAGAAALLERVAREREGLLGPEHPDTLGSRENLENALRLRGGTTPSGGAPAAEEVEVEEGEGEGAPDAASGMAGLESLSKALRTFLVSPRDSIGESLAAREALGSCLIGTGRLKEPGDQVRKLEKNVLLYGPNHSKTLQAAHTLGIALRLKARFREAAAVLSWALAGRLVTATGQDLRPFQTWRILGLTLADMGETEEAEIHLAQVARGCQMAFGLDHKETVLCLESLADTLELDHKTVEAEKIRDRLRTVRAARSR